jgi:hypothetical protein
MAAVRSQKVFFLDNDLAPFFEASKGVKNIAVCQPRKAAKYKVSLANPICHFMLKVSRQSRETLDVFMALNLTAIAARVDRDIVAVCVVYRGCVPVESPPKRLVFLVILKPDGQPRRLVSHCLHSVSDK